MNADPDPATQINTDPDPQPCLAHDESAEDLVEAVAVLRLADDEILQLGVLEPYRVGRLHAGFEGHGLGSYKRDSYLDNHHAINMYRSYQECFGSIFFKFRSGNLVRRNRIDVDKKWKHQAL